MNSLWNYLKGVEKGKHRRSVTYFALALLATAFGVIGILIGVDALGGPETYTKTERVIDLWIGRSSLAIAAFLLALFFIARYGEVVRKDDEQFDHLWQDSHAARVGSLKKGH